MTKSVGDDVLDLLLHTPISELIRKLIPNEIPLAPNTVCLDLNKGAWKCHLVAPIHYILNLRQRLGIAWNEEEQVLYAKVKTSIKASRMRMLTKSATMNEPTILVEEEEEENLIPEVVEPVDTKKATLSYQFKKQTILNDLGGTLDIYIYERPHK